MVLLKYYPLNGKIEREYFSRSHLGLKNAPKDVKDIASLYWPHLDRRNKIETWLSNTGLTDVIDPIDKELQLIYPPRIKRLKESIIEYRRKFNLTTRPPVPRMVRDKERVKLEKRIKEINSQISQFEAETNIHPRIPKYISRALALPGYLNLDGKIKVVDNFREILEKELFPVGIQNGQDSCPLKPGEIDRRGMERVMEFEKTIGRNPQAVDQILGLGYDIASYFNGRLVRTIEVKSFYDTGNFNLELYEKNHADRNPELSWVYMVEQCKMDKKDDRKIFQIKAITQKHQFSASEYTTIRFPISKNVWKSLIEPSNS